MKSTFSSIAPVDNPYGISKHELGDIVDFDRRSDRSRQEGLINGAGGIPGLIDKLQTSLEHGLTIKEKEGDLVKRQAVYGINKPPPPRTVTFGELVYVAFQDRVLQILMVGAILTLVVSMVQHAATGWHEGISILLTIAIVVGCGCGNDFFKEIKFQQIMAKASIKKCKVLRDGIEQPIWVHDVVVGDIVLLASGDEIPADGLWVSGHMIVVDESALTGESDPFRKDHQKPSLFSGSLCTDGKAKMLVTAVGPSTTGGKVMELLNQVSKSTTPLQEKLTVMAIDISKIAFIVALATWAGLLGWWGKDISEYGWQKRPWFKPGEGMQPSSLTSLVHDFVTIITLIVVAVPDGLPLATTLSLVYSMLNLMKRNNFVRNLAAAETMGCVTCICSDKTGTLTQNKMAVTRVWYGGIVVPVLKEDMTIFDTEWRLMVQEAVQGNSTAILSVEANGEVTVTGSKTEGALFKFLDAINMPPTRKLQKVKEWPFTSDRKRMTTFIKRENGLYRVHVKGAPEMLLPLCKDIFFGPGDLRPATDAMTHELINTITTLASLGLRTILAGYKDLGADFKPDMTPEELEKDLTILVVFGIEDPVRPEVPAAIRTCQGAGVTVRMCTGDNQYTAKKIAQDCGIWQPKSIIMEGPAFRVLTEEERVRVIPNLHVLARSSPQDKYVLVQALKKMGEVVAVTGDGTNDAPALREANIGFAMGIQGTDVAKNASDIVLLDDRFDSILQAMLWGRNAYQSITKFLQFQFAINLTSCLVTLISACANMGTPLNAVMLLWINLIMDTLGALAMATEYPDPRVLQQKPRGKNDRVLSANMIAYVLTESAWQLSVIFWFMYDGYQYFGIAFEDKKAVYTLVFNVNILMQVVNELNGRHLEWTLNLYRGITRNRFMLPILILIVAVQILLVQVAHDFVGCVPLSLQQWIGCFLVALVGIPMGWVHQVYDLRKKTLEQSKIAAESLPRYLADGKPEVS